MGLMDKLKATAQDVATEAKKATSQAGEKAKKATSQAQEKLEQVQTRKKADEAARSLGYLIHAERTKGAPAGPEADRLVAEITSLQASLSAGESAATSPAGYVAPQPEATGAPPQPPPGTPPA